MDGYEIARVLSPDEIATALATLGDLYEELSGDVDATHEVHGTRNRFLRGCRCDDCRAAERAYQKAWRARRAAS